ncbi:hypothetical protein BDV27DRAFT_166020 [Aspergillus caelatus]|uniref:Uncharacterized protein n=1 Tax=Aspergillus caelatus TaxID=61420 RepID=A0A5N7A0J7_9EURO|nr:uncharacterized protein BDV27DRAFT_166020 [Aspergillus caelatus]KAE8362699.1 hypothetical protein BDV27DRAFT_166020 [Aspergillus caelatus]
MKFSISSALLITATIFSVGNAAPPNLPAPCLEIPQALSQQPTRIMQYFNAQVCERARCVATINEYNQYLHNNIVPQLIQDVNNNLGVSADEQALLNQFRTQLVAVAQQSCAAEGNRPLCNNPEGLLNYNACVTRATQPILEQQANQLSNVAQLTAEKCQKVKQLISDETFWSKNLPGYIDQFAAMCKKGN